MATNRTSTNGTGKLAAAATVVTESDLEELEALLAELRKRTLEAHDNGRTFMMQQYTVLVASVQPQVKKLRDRFDRESLAGFRKAHRMLKDAESGDEEAEA